MKIIMSVICSLILASCASIKNEEPSAKKQVAGLTKMCKEAGPAMKARQAKKSFYERLGREKGIKEFSNKLYASHKNNEQIGHMFKHVPRGPFVSRVTNFLIAGTGGKSKYSGRSMKDVHKNMKISHSDFLAAGGDVQSVMKSMSLGENEIQEMVCALVSFVPVVVTTE